MHKRQKKWVRIVYIILVLMIGFGMVGLSFY